MITQDLWQIFSIIVLLLLSVGMILFLVIRFEYAVILLVLSPWISSILYINTVNTSVNSEPALGSFLRISLVLIVGAAGLAKFVILRYKPNQLPLHFFILGVFILYCLISTTYSIDQIYTLIRSITFLAIFFFLLGFYAWLNSYEKLIQVFQYLYLIILFFTIINIISLLIFPGLYMII
jgi:hypothetical protein